MDDRLHSSLCPDYSSWLKNSVPTISSCVSDTYTTLWHSPCFRTKVDLGRISDIHCISNFWRTWQHCVLLPEPTLTGQLWLWIVQWCTSTFTMSGHIWPSGLWHKASRQEECPDNWSYSYDSCPSPLSPFVGKDFLKTELDVTDGTF